MLARARQVADQYRRQRQDASALYWADKALSLSNGALDDFVVYVQCLYDCKQYKRAIMRLDSSTLLEKSSTLRYLAARCVCVDLVEFFSNHYAFISCCV